MCEALFRKSATRHYEQPKAIRMLSHKAQYCAHIFTADWDREWVGKDRSAF